MNVKNLVTTLREHKIGTSFTTNESYFVSTVCKNKRSYETIIKKAGIWSKPLNLLYAISPKEAMINHIALARAAISLDEKSWMMLSWKGDIVNEYMPTELIGSLDKNKASQEPNTFLSEYCQLLMETSGLNCKQ